MNESELFLELEEPLRQLSGGISALELMVYGLSKVSDPYTEGFQAVWRCLRKAELELKTALGQPIPPSRPHTA